MKTIVGYFRDDQSDGAVDLDTACSIRPCTCGRCAVCGNVKHSAVHGPILGSPPGSKPWGHRFQTENQHE